MRPICMAAALAAAMSRLCQMAGCEMRPGHVALMLLALTTPVDARGEWPDGPNKQFLEQLQRPGVGPAVANQEPEPTSSQIVAVILREAVNRAGDANPIIRATPILALNRRSEGFGRWSWNDGKTEIQAFTDIDASLHRPIYDDINAVTLKCGPAFASCSRQAASCSRQANVVQ